MNLVGDEKNLKFTPKLGRKLMKRCNNWNEFLLPVRRFWASRRVLRHDLGESERMASQ